MIDALRFLEIEYRCNLGAKIVPDLIGPLLFEADPLRRLKQGHEYGLAHLPTMVLTCLPSASVCKLCCRLTNGLKQAWQGLIRPRFPSS